MKKLFLIASLFTAFACNTNTPSGPTTDSTVTVVDTPKTDSTKVDSVVTTTPDSTQSDTTKKL